MAVYLGNEPISLYGGTKIVEVGTTMTQPYIEEVLTYTTTTVDGLSLERGMPTTAKLVDFKDIRSYQFYDCYTLRSVELPNDIKSVGKYAFYGCTSLADISLLNATHIESFAFYNCSHLSTLDLPEVIYIGANAFYKCSSLSSLNLPKVTSIGSSAFRDCTNLATLILRNTSSVCTYSNTSSSYDPLNDNLKIYVPVILIEDYKIATNWSRLANKFYPIEGGIGSFKGGFTTYNQIIQISVPILIGLNGEIPENFTVTSSSETIGTISDVVIGKDAVTFNFNSLSTGGETTITVSCLANGVSQERSAVYKVSETIPESTYEVVAIEGVTHGFELNSNAYYESTNKGIDNSYSLCQVNISNPLRRTVYIDCISYGENNYDYGILSNVNTTLTQSNSVDSSNVKKSFKGAASTNVQTVEYTDAVDDCYIQIKYIKDNSQSSGNDSLQFKVRFE